MADLAASDPAAPPAVATTPGPVKPGYKTTEFWLTVAAHVAGGLVASGTLGHGEAAKIAGLVVMVLAQLGYTASRAYVKS